MSVCRRCGASILWVRTAKRDRWMPLDAEPTPLGHVVLDANGRAVVLSDTARNRTASAGRETIYRAHFATCNGEAA